MCGGGLCAPNDSLIRCSATNRLPPRDSNPGVGFGQPPALLVVCRQLRRKRQDTARLVGRLTKSFCTSVGKEKHFAGERCACLHIVPELMGQICVDQGEYPPIATRHCSLAHEHCPSNPVFGLGLEAARNETNARVKTPQRTRWCGDDRECGRRANYGGNEVVAGGSSTIHSGLRSLQSNTSADSRKYGGRNLVRRFRTRD